jgi:hypothetical protein
MKTTLDPYELQIAAFIGCRRRVETLKASLRDAHGFDGGGAWDIDVMGASAEMALAKMLNIYWCGDVNTFKLPDVGSLQVRSTSLEHGSLIVRENDSDNDIFVLMILERPSTYHFGGWTFGVDAVQRKYRRAPNGRPPAFFVPQRDLNQSFKKLEAIVFP